MRISTRRAAPFLALGTLLLALGTAHAQGEAKGDAKAAPPVYAFFSSSAEFPLVGVPNKEGPTYLKSLSTRLNTENTVFAYLHNTSGLDQSVNVYLQAGDEASRVTLAQNVAQIEMKANEIRKVAFTPTKAATTAAAPVTPPVAGEKPKEPEPEALKPRGDKLPTGARNLYLRVASSAAKFDLIGGKGEEVYVINKKAPEGFTVVVTASVNTVTAVVTYKTNAKRLSVAPVKVRLDMRPDMNDGLDAASALEGTFVAELPALDENEEATATLVAKNLKFTRTEKNKKLSFAVTIDGYDRAYLYETDFTGSEPLTVVTAQNAVTNARLSAKAQVPGKPVTITIEADGVEAGSSIQLLVNRLDDGTPTEVMRKFSADRSRELYLLVGEDGAVTLTPVVKDWTVEFPTAQVAGKRAFAVRVVKAAKKPDGQGVEETIKAEPELPKQVLIIDRTPPDKVAFLEPSPKALLLVGKELKLTAAGQDRDSEIAKVYFFTGETPPGLDGKPAPGSRVIPGELVPEVKPAPGGRATPGVVGAEKLATYKTKEPFRLPEAKGELRLGVVFFNKVGLSTVAEMTQYVSVPAVPGADKPTTGSIIGRAVQAGRPQPGLPVTLSDAAGKVVKETKSDDVGKFEFKELAPGNYTVVAVKRADANASGKATVEVKAAKEPTQIPALTIKR